MHITIRLNGAQRRVPDGQTLAALLAGLDLPPHALATVVNGAFVARALRAQQVLHQGDAVLTFQAITGG